VEELQWRWAVWPAFNFKMWISDCPSEKHYPRKSSVDCPRSCRRGWNIQWFMPHSFNGRFKHASGLSKICAKTLDRWSETAKIFHMRKSPPNIITGDKRWVYGYDIETKQESSQWKSPALPRTKEAWQLHSRVKTMLIVFFYHEDILHCEFSPEGQTVDQDFYLVVLRLSYTI
jgi:hypothetical protein